MAPSPRSSIRAFRRSLFALAPLSVRHGVRLWPSLQMVPTPRPLRPGRHHHQLPTALLPAGPILSESERYLISPCAILSSFNLSLSLFLSLSLSLSLSLYIYLYIYIYLSIYQSIKQSKNKKKKIYIYINL